MPINEIIITLCLDLYFNEIIYWDRYGSGEKKQGWIKEDFSSTKSSLKKIKEHLEILQT